ncbi:hypothetical protein SFR_4486 [Streptomyces sp. FR-008]|nr:hypothetical protein SFR_4486 [Streptomyces sp. FR-008]
MPTCWTCSPESDWVWSIPDFDGTGRLPDGLGHQEFREKV